MGSLESLKPVAAMVGLNFGYAIMNIMTRSALTGGMSSYVFAAYRQQVAAITVAPFAFFLERKERPPLTLPVFGRIFMLSFIGVLMNQTFYFKGLYLASSTLAGAMENLIPALTFLIAIILGLEKVNMRSIRGEAKLLGTLICVIGALVMTLYKGPLIEKHWPRSLHVGGNHFVIEDWQMGCLYLFGSCICWSAWIIMQVSTIKKYPAQLSLSAMLCFFGAVQCTVVASIIDPDLKTWTIGSNIELLSVLFSGIVCSGIAFCVQTWCISKRGPVFVATFTPLLTVIVAAMATIILHEKVHAGSVVGSVLIIGGLYAVLWGKSKDTVLNEDQLTAMGVAKGLSDSIQGTKSPDLSIDITEPLLAKEASKDLMLRRDGK
ncbi:auxin-induced protein 5NG4-like [Cryptomeria japonica]|uniref:auxin-induced protein 5NG4-like n=1 Tax=Cryptomeria japonica TaxID=3369 RepID=UPI0027DA40E1|nr:auxin-induced protein 5NG4-like [Cryptomeria japonica]